MFIHLVPLYGAIMSIAFLGESLHIYQAVGMAAILAGLACSNIVDEYGLRWTRHRKPKTTDAVRQDSQGDQITKGSGA
jgi:drug/metabolite transporter (DMT)-like permease